MPGRQQIPSFQMARGSTNERDTQTEVGSIFYNTDTSNVEVYHEDLSNNVGWRDLVMNNKEQIDISGKLVVDEAAVSKVTFPDGTTMATATTDNETKIENGNSSMEIATSNGACVFTPNGNAANATTFETDGDITTAGDIIIPQVYAISGTSDKLLFKDNSPNTSFGNAGINFIGGAQYNEANGSRLSFFTNDTASLNIIKNGNVGIGTTNPTQKLDVDGYIKHKNVRFSAYSTNGNVTKSGYNSPFVLEKTFYNVGSCYNAGTGIFTAPVTGHYRFTLTVFRQSGHGQAALWYSSTSNGALSDAAPAYFMSHTGGDTILMSTPSVGTHCGVFDVYVPINYQIAFGARTAASMTIYQAHSFFSGELISPA